MKIVCPVCGKQFHVKPSRCKRSKNVCCSVECSKAIRSISMKGAGNHQYGLKGNKNSTWKSDTKISRYGYRLVRVLDHPFRAKDDFVFEHRLVAEANLLTPENTVVVDGKPYLSKDYVVHHKNGNRLDNRVENLEILKRGDHSSMHQKTDPQPKDPQTHRFVKRKSSPEKMRVVIGENGFLPNRAHAADAGYDLRTPTVFTVPAMSRATVSTRVRMSIPVGYAGFVRSKSGLSKNHGLYCEGVVDAEYTGEVCCTVFNHSNEDYTFQAGDKVAQIVIVPILTPELELVGELEQTERGSGGFGSTGIR